MLLRNLHKQIFILVLLIVSSHADIELFRAEKLDFTKSTYPWADELYLHVKGIASNKIKGGFLTVSIYFEEKKIRWFDITIPEDAPSFDKKWGPLNSATQEVQPGKYKVVLEFILENQNKRIFDAVEKVIGKNKIKSIGSIFDLGNKEEIGVQAKKDKIFYLDIMKSINKSFELFITKRNSVFGNIVKNQKGNYLREWRTWIRDSFLVEIAKQKGILEKREKQFFALRYATTHHNMMLYCDLLKEISINYTYSFLEYENGNKNYKSPYSLSELSKSMLHIRLLHEESAREMDVDLDKELGYTPPPPNSF